MENETIVLYHSMKRIRMVEEALAANYYNEIREMKTPLHLSNGQEAVAVGVCANLRQTDYIFGNHRSHAHYLAKGGDIRAFFAELHNKRTGCSKGKGASMHLVDRKHGVSVTSSIVAGNVSIATGYAMAQQMRNDGGVTVAFLGDGATEEGSVYESICFAKLKKLPILFCCENNGLAISTPLQFREPNSNISSKFSNILPVETTDGNDVLAVQEITEKLLERARSGGGPAFVECMTYRYLNHSNIDDGTDGIYRTKEEIERWKQKDPILLLERHLLDEHKLDSNDIERIQREIAEEIEAAFSYARQSELPAASDLWEGVYA